MGHKGCESTGDERGRSQVGREQAGLWYIRVQQDTQEWLVYYTNGLRHKYYSCMFNVWLLIRECQFLRANQLTQISFISN
jgi:hypothetical protein